MAKYYGKIGFAVTSEKIIDGMNSGVWEENIVERPYYGELVNNRRRLQNSDRVNSDITISNEVSIVADPYAVNNFQSIRYATYLSAKWTVTSVEVKYPRLILTLGGVYNA